MTNILDHNTLNITHRAAFKRTPSWTLLEATREGNLREIKKWLTNGADINAVIPFAPGTLERGLFMKEDTPLLSAVRYEHFECARYLLSQGADINAQDQIGYTPLSLAVINSHSLRGDNYNFVKELLSQGADTEKCDRNNNTPLHQAIWEKDAVLFEILLAAGANIYHCNKAHISPFVLANEYLNTNGDVDYESSHDEDEIMIGIAFKTFLLGNPENSDDLFHDHLRKAIKNDHQRCALYLAKKLIDINKQDAHGCTPLMLAVMNRQPLLIKEFLALGADLQQVNKRKLTPLHIAARQDNLASVELLVAAGADIFDKGQLKNKTPYSIIKDHVKQSTNPNDEAHRIWAFMERARLSDLINHDEPGHECVGLSM